MRKLGFGILASLCWRSNRKVYLNVISDRIVVKKAAAALFLSHQFHNVLQHVWPVHQTGLQAVNLVRDECFRSEFMKSFGAALKVSCRQGAGHRGLVKNIHGDVRRSYL